MLVCAETSPRHTPSVFGAVVQALAMLTFVAGPETMALALTLTIACPVAGASARATPEKAVRTLPASFALALSIRRVAAAVATALFVAVLNTGAH